MTTADEEVGTMALEDTLGVLRENRDLLNDFSVAALYVFGSAVRGEEHSDSDVDILVEFAPGARVGLFAFARLQRRLSELLGRRVDLVTRDALHPALRQTILSEAVRAA